MHPSTTHGTHPGAPAVAAEQAARLASEASGQRVTAKASARLVGELSGHLFCLDNGLELLLAVDNRAPLFAYQTWFRVGSRDESPERTGLAHLFEHLMFKGTTTYPSGTFDQEMERRGATTNAATWVDWTYYTQSLAQEGDNLAVAIAFEADRMHALVIDQKTFDSELEVVKNELRMSVDNSVAGQMGEALFALRFERHSYRWPTIGSLEHLAAASLDDLRAFYRQHYQPSNATVVLCGDLDLTASLTELARQYGPLPSARRTRQVPPCEPPQQAGRLRTLVTQVMAPQLVLGFPAPAEGARAHAALEMALLLAVDGDAAWLYDALVTKQKVASEVGGYLTPFAEPGIIEVSAVANAKVSPSELLASVRAALYGLEARIDAAALARARNGLLFGYYDGLRDVESLAEALGHEQVNSGNFQHAFARPALWQSLTVEDVRAAWRAAVRPEQENAVVAVQTAEQEAIFLQQSQGREESRERQ